MNRGLAAYPDNIRLLEARSGFYCERGMLAECRADALRIVELQPNHAEAFLGLCMLDEVQGADPQGYEACYLKAAELFAARPSTRPRGWDAKQWEIANRANYTFALLLANHPDAEKAAFLERVASDPTLDRLYGRMFEELDKDRKSLLRKMLGGR